MTPPRVWAPSSTSGSPWPADLDDNPDPPTLLGLVISPRTRCSYLGYERSDARRPAVLAALLRWRHRGTFLALWDDV